MEQKKIFSMGQKKNKNWTNVFVLMKADGRK